MSIRYLIDGYNVLYALDEIPPGTWQEKRTYLISYLRTHRPQGNNPITVVFDSREGLGNQTQEKDITVVYTAGETADDWIGFEVRKVSNPRALAVVSNDQGIHTLVRGTGARFILVKDFLKQIAAARKSSHPSSRVLPPDTTDITEEFKKKWL